MNGLTKNQYSEIVEKHSPPSPVLKNTLAAFVSGGVICTLGEGLGKLYAFFGADKTSAAAWVSISLIFLAALLTALNVFDNLARICGAGTLVPITGFSNSVVSAAMEFKTEGLVTGTGAKIFIVAGPVIMYGTVSSIIFGLLHLIFK